MSEQQELKPCQCGMNLTKADHSYIHETTPDQYMSRDPDPQCPMAGVLHIGPNNTDAINAWNARPLEESLQDRLEELERILQKERGNLGWIIMLLEDNMPPDKIVKMLEAQLDRINNQETSPPDNTIDEAEL